MLKTGSVPFRQSEPGYELAELGDGHQPDLLKLPVRGAGRRYNPPREPQFRGLLKALVHMAHRSNRAGQADLAEIDAVLGRRASGEGGEERSCCGEVGGRIAEFQAAGDVELDVMGAKPRAAAGLEHGDEHGEPVRVPSDHGTSWHAQ